MLLSIDSASYLPKLVPRCGPFGSVARHKYGSVLLPPPKWTRTAFFLVSSPLPNCVMALNDWPLAGIATISTDGCERTLHRALGKGSCRLLFEIADTCGRLVARSESAGRPMEPRDAFIAATAEVHGLTLVTRNASDFEATVKAIATPWT